MISCDQTSLVYIGAESPRVWAIDPFWFVDEQLKIPYIPTQISGAFDPNDRGLLAYISYEVSAVVGNRVAVRTLDPVTPILWALKEKKNLLSDEWVPK